MIELIRNPNINFLGKRNIAFLVSGIFAIIGIIAIVRIATGHANLGIDFAGGTAIQLKFEKNIATPRCQACPRKQRPERF